METADFSREVSREIIRSYRQGLQEVLPSARMLYTTLSSSHGTERLVGSRGFPMHGARAGEETPYTLLETAEGHSKLFTHQEYLNGRKLTAALARRLTPETAAELGYQMAMSGLYTIDYILWAVISAGFATTTTADGEFLFSATHALEGGGTASNLGAAGLSYATFWAAWQMLFQTKTSEGLITPRAPKYLVVSAENKEPAHQIVQSGVTSAENQRNVVNSTQDLEIAVSPLFIDADDWMLSTEPSPGGLTCFEEVSPDLVYYGPDQNQDRTHVWNSLMSISAGAADWRWGFGAGV